jgi:hypothetical protein
VFDLPPIWFMAMASVSCASLEMEPYDMAPDENRFTMLAAGSTASSGMGARPISSAARMRNSPRTVFRWLSPSFTRRA